ncbi:glucoside xylosyltransferase 1-like [Haemaphysalis longicornis]
MSREDATPQTPDASLRRAFNRASWRRVFFLVLFGSTALEICLFLGQELYATRIPLGGNGAKPIEAIKATQTGTITLVFVVCGYYYDLSLTAVKSAIAYSYSDLHLIIAADEEIFPKWRNEVDHWPEAIRGRVHADVLDLHYPLKDINYKRYIGKLCSSQKMFLSTMLPEVDAVMYADAEVVFVHNVEYVWQNFFAMNAREIAAMVVDTTKGDNTRNTFVGATQTPASLGLNTGLILMNLTRMRKFGFERRIDEAWRQYGTHTLLSDNEMLEAVFMQDPQLVHALDSRWNFRTSNCYKPGNNTDHPIATLLGDNEVFEMGTEPAFKAVYSSMKQYTLGKSLAETFIPLLEQELNSTADTPCKRVFTRQLHTWRLSATRVDCTAATKAPRNSSETAHLRLPRNCSALLRS